MKHTVSQLLHGHIVKDINTEAFIDVVRRDLEISDSEAEKIADEIINVLMEHELSVCQSKKVLNIALNAIEIQSRLLRL